MQASAIPTKMTINTPPGPCDRSRSGSEGSGARQWIGRVVAVLLGRYDSKLAE